MAARVPTHNETELNGFLYVDGISKAVITGAAISSRKANFRILPDHYEVNELDLDEGLTGACRRFARASRGDKALEQYRRWVFGEGPLEGISARYFADGAVIGSRDWVNGVFASRRERFGPKRTEGARRFRFLAGTELFSVRDLRIDPVTLSGVPGGDS